MSLIDITVPIHDGMFVYERNPGVHLERVLDMGKGEKANVSRLDLGLHTGTHIDAPAHFFADGAGAETIPLDALIGNAHVVDATALNQDIDAASLERLDVPWGAERLLFKTPNSALWERETFTREFIRFTGSGARLLVERGVRLVGIDYLSIGDADAHRLFLGGGVVPLEGLDLREVAPGPYHLICLPLRVVGADGAPARAVLGPAQPPLEHAAA